ncbi:MFS transporter [Bacillus kexueae]|uniref:MFS transporter n=1 Tax=Aeribacillus kexueae TaxID=2078952 RepID=UPI001FAEA2A4|nr:MFS transporter [Bacillus kexueae]
MWFANFFVAASATMILPFLSLYIETFSTYSEEFVQRWAGYVFGITFLMAFFVSPLWGRFADKNGYKKILLITGTGIATSILLMGFVSSVYQLFFLRLGMGLVTGFIPTSLAFISSQTPKETAGKTLGTLQMGTVSGGLLGPVLGGMLADSFGFQYSFFITAAVIYFAVILVYVGVVEKHSEKQANEMDHHTRKDVLHMIVKDPMLLSVMVISLLVQTGNFSIQPLLALYVQDLHGPGQIAFFAGLAFSATGLGNLLSARRWGQLGDRIGYEKVLMLLLVFGAILFIPQALATSLWQLVLFRFLYGLSLGGIIPTITAFIRQKAPVSMQGEVMGYNTSLRFLGNVTGPVLGGIIASFVSISSVFYVTSLLFITSAVLLWKVIRWESSNAKRLIES